MKTFKKSLCVSLIGLASLLLLCASLTAHPVPKNQHDRTIVVTLSKTAGDTVKVAVAFRLEVDEYTVMARDMRPFLDQIDLTKAKDKRRAFYEEYIRRYAPILVHNLAVKINDKPLPLTCTKRTFSLADDDGQPLGHLRCDFLFVAEKQLAPDEEHRFAFREGNWLDEWGLIDLSLQDEGELQVFDIRQPDAELKSKDLSQLAPGDEEKLRTLAAVFRLDAETIPKAEPEPPAAVAVKEETTGAVRKDGSLVSLMHDYQHAIWLLLILSIFFGAAHALTPGHGKTLIAAYLVGEHGTYVHAFVLGVVTTLTHTGIVLLFAAGLLFVPEVWLQSVIRGLQLMFGVAIAVIGFWLLICRLSGRADHVHIGGGHHHHHDHHHHHHDHHHHDHSHADHAHDEHGNVIPKAQDKPILGWWGMIVMGMQGGIVPCWDAVALLFAAVAMGYLYLALPMILAFSAGLAGVLVLIGMVVVSSKKFAQSRWGESRLVQMLPIVSACIVIAIGMWLCYDGVHGYH